ncbi:MAG: hypothetical protein WCI93_01495 [bacterium]
MDLFSTNIAYASENVDQFIMKVNQHIINPIILFLFALALLFFLYGIVEFISNQENEEKKTTGKMHMIWGIVGITIMMSVWALLSIILNTIGVPKSQIDPENGTVNLPVAN